MEMLYLLIYFGSYWVNSLQVDKNLLERGVSKFMGQSQLFRYDLNKSLPYIMQVSGPENLTRLPGQEQVLD